MLKWRLLLTFQLYFCACDIRKKYFFFSWNFWLLTKDFSGALGMNKEGINFRQKCNQRGKRENDLLTFSILLNERIMEQAWMLDISDCLLGLCSSILITNPFQGTFTMEGPASRSAILARQCHSAEEPEHGPETAFRIHPLSAALEVGSLLPWSSLRARKGASCSCHLKVSNFQ